MRTCTDIQVVSNNSNKYVNEYTMHYMVAYVCGCSCEHVWTFKLFRTTCLIINTTHLVLYRSADVHTNIRGPDDINDKFIILYCLLVQRY
jgi:hypothetical protein